MRIRSLVTVINLSITDIFGNLGQLGLEPDTWKICQIHWRIWWDPDSARIFILMESHPARVSFSFRKLLDL